MRHRLREALAANGVAVRRMSPEDRLLRSGYDPRHGPDATSSAYLQPSNPRLCELEGLYSLVASDPLSPNATESTWRAASASSVDDLHYFRGDNLYLWQYTRSVEMNRLRSFIYYRATASADELSLLGVLDEDGAFGCLTFDFDGKTVSRDLLDSVNELSFIARHTDLFSSTDAGVLDVGAGYGRLAHRMLVATSGVSRFYCVDAVARSTFLCEFYLRFRGLGERSNVVDLGAFQKGDHGIARGTVDLATNVHSFSEMPRHSVEAWVRWLGELEVRHLFVVPNERERILSREPDGQRLDCADLFTRYGYGLKVVEPALADAEVRRVLDVEDMFLLFERS